MLLLDMVRCQLKVDCEDTALVTDLHNQVCYRMLCLHY